MTDRSNQRWMTPEESRRQARRVTERVNFIEPKSLDEGLVQLSELETERELLRSEIMQKTEENFPTRRAFSSWKFRAEFNLRILTARLRLLRDWIERAKQVLRQEHAGPGDTKKFDLIIPASLEDGEKVLAELTRTILDIQGQLGALSGSERKIERRGLIKKLTPLQATRKTLATWIKEQRRAHHEETRAKRAALSQALDLTDPVNVAFHAVNLLLRILKRTNLVLAEEGEQALVEDLKEFLRTQGVYD